MEDFDEALEGLLDQALSDDATPSGEDPGGDPDPEDGVDATATESEEGSEGEPSQGDPSDGDDEESVEGDEADEDDLAPKPSFIGNQPSPPDQKVGLPEITQLQQVIQSQAAMIQEFTRKQQLSEQQKALAALEAKWAEMDPEDAAAERAKFAVSAAQQRVKQLNDELVRVQQEKAAQEQAEKEAVAKAASVDLIAYQFGLKNADKATLALFDTPQQMIYWASMEKGKRTKQTANARAARAEQLAANKALASGTSGGAANTTGGVEVNTLEELLDAIF